MFLRKYSLSIGGGSGKTLIESGEERSLRVTFDITHEWGGNRSLANIAIYGLSKTTEGVLYKEYDEIYFSAGYRESFGQIFSGEIKNVIKERNGPDRITRIFALSDRKTIDKASISTAIGAGSDVVDAIEKCASSIGVTVEINKSDFADEKSYSRGKVLAGDPVKILRDLSSTHGFNFTIESGRCRILKDGKSLKNKPIIIGQDSGMIGSPEITEYGVNVAVNLTPKIKLGQKIEIDSRTPRIVISDVVYQNIQTTVDVGEYTVQQITHSGDSHADTWETKLTGWRFGQ